MNSPNETFDSQNIIHILNNLYRENINQINFYKNANNEIRQTLNNILNEPIRPHITIRGRHLTTQLNPNSTPHRYTVTDDSSDDNNTSSRTYTNGVDFISFHNNCLPILKTPISNNNTNLTLNMKYINDLYMQHLNLTLPEITQLTRIIQYKNITNPFNQECPISLEKFKDNDIVIVICHCSHIFDKIHLLKWLKVHRNCPICRFHLQPELFSQT
jgi:hypothetical protein